MTPKYYIASLVIVLFISTAFLETSEKDHCYIVGNSRDSIVQVLRTNSTVNFCYQDFYDENIKHFTGIKYGSGGRGCKKYQTLVNIKQMNCVTFIENFLAMALAARDIGQHKTYLSNEQCFDIFVNYLNDFRYYNGQNCGWDDRYHYFTAALMNLEAGGQLQDMGRLYGYPFSKQINYMSRHKKYYGGIKDWKKIRSYEAEISEAKRYYFPLNALDKYNEIAQNGDIVALSTDKDGLDVSHCGFVSWKDHELTFSHASSIKKQIVIEQDFCDYMGTRTSVTGIIVYRPTF